MRLKLDLNVNALYIRLTDENVARTRTLDDNTFVDLDAAGRLIGIEVVSLAHPWQLSEILATYRIKPLDAQQLRLYFGLPPATRTRKAAPKPAPMPLLAPPSLSIERVAPLEPQPA